MSYRIAYRPAARKAINKLDGRIRQRVLKAIKKLAANPHPPGSEKLSGGDNEYRIRIGDYRIIYAIEDDRLRVLVIDAGHRKDIYEKWKRGR